MPGGMGGFGGSGGMMGGGPGVGPFGQSTSTTARQQEVTWIYNRKFKDVKGNTNVVSYEFLIGPGGRVSQIRVPGYYSKGTRTQRGVVLPVIAPRPSDRHRSNTLSNVGRAHQH